MFPLNSLFLFFIPHFQKRKDQKPKEERIDLYRPQGEEFDKAYTYEYTHRTDDTETSEQHGTSEKITVSATGITQMEETERQRYPKDLDIGRIVVEERPEEKQEMPKRDVLKRDVVKPRHEDMETRYEAERETKRGPKAQVREDLVKVGRLDITDYEKVSRDSEQVEKRATHTERLGKLQKVA